MLMWKWSVFYSLRSKILKISEVWARDFALHADESVPWVHH